MNMRIDFYWTRDEGAALRAKQYDYFIDTKAPEIRKKEELKNYLKEWANRWVGNCKLEFISACSSLQDENLEKISDELSGQVFLVGNMGR